MNKTIIKIIIFVLGTVFGIFLGQQSPIPEPDIIFITDPSFPNTRYNKLDRILQQSSAQEYDLDYNCGDFANDLQARLAKNGIASERINGVLENKLHAWNCIWIEPQTGNFISTEDKYYN